MPFESFGQRIARHIHAGEVDFGTIVRGVETFSKWVRSNDILSSKIEESSHVSNTAGNKMLARTRYEYVKRSGWIAGNYEVIDFPDDYQLRINVTSIDKTLNIHDHLDRQKGAIAEFVGPTILEHLPNNGFFMSHNPSARVPFMDTDPSGERRGAIIINKNN